MGAVLDKDLTKECRVLFAHSIFYENRYYTLIVMEDNRDQFICVTDLFCIRRSHFKNKNIARMTDCGVSMDFACMIHEYIESMLGLEG